MKIHFIGIGGIGISALARIFQEQGNEVSGSDANKSALTEDLAKIGIKIFQGHSAENVSDDVDRVIYTEAIPKENPEYQKAKNLGVSFLTYFQALGEFSNEYRVIAIAGTHGKTTTTAMTALALIEGEIDPNVIIGTKVAEFENRNVRIGKSDYLVVESCEYRESFLNLTPQILVITNVEAEHLDYYKTEENYLNAFKKLCQKVPRSGYIVTIDGDENVDKVVEGVEAKVIKLQITNDELLIVKKVPISEAKGDTGGVDNDEIQSERLKVQNNQKDISQETNKETLRFKSKTLNQHSILNQHSKQTTTNYQLPTLQVPGDHYKLDAALAMAVGILSGVEEEVLKKALASFKGTWRRFERKGEKDGVIVIDDYAHHPTEIQATLRGAREMFDEKKIICVFQPHQYSRTRLLFNNFVQSFVDCDEVIIPNIYKVRDTEEDVKAVNAAMLVNAIDDYSGNATFGEGFENTVKLLEEKLQAENVLITMGAGPVNEVGEMYLGE